MIYYVLFLGVMQLEFVQPIREKKQIDSMKKILKSTNLRDYCLFTLGINSGLRISDLYLSTENWSTF